MKKIAIITGSSSGLGREFVRQIDRAREVDEFWLLDLNKQGLEELAKELQVPVKIYPGDISAPEFQEELAKDLADASQNAKKVEYLINSAGVGYNEKFRDLSVAKNLLMIDINIRALTSICHIVIPYLNRGGKILNVASVSAFMPQYKFSVYSATKSYVLNFSRALNSELENQTVVAVCPNPMRTNFFGDGSGPKGIKALGVECVDKVASKALRKARKGKDISLQSFLAHLLKFISHVLPHRLVLWFERVSDK